jgi:exopolysaccharide biosynthesis polyprenyl glycosylphosphotransferase
MSFRICFSQLYVRVNLFLLLASFLIGIMLPTFSDVMRRGFYKEFVATLRHVGLLLLVSAFYLFLTKDADVVSRFTVVAFSLLYLPYTYSIRILRKYQLLKRNYLNKGEESLLLLTTASQAEQVLQEFRKDASGGYRIIGIALMDREKAQGSVKDIPVIATQESIIEYLSHRWIDEVFICVPDSFQWKEPVVDALIEMGVTTHIKLNGIRHKTDNSQFVEEIAGFTVLTSTLSRGSEFQIGIKRCMDILGGLVGCLFTGILFLFLAPAIYAQSPGPIFFRQTRVGRNGKQFRIYKFRSMYMDAEERKQSLLGRNQVKDGMMFKLENDPRIIGSEKGAGKGIGNFIRKYSLDEFPQFFNVLRGEMSLVGTRPPTVDEWEKYDLHHRARLAVKPGLTGLWQVSGRSNISDFEEVVRLDKEYIRNWDIGLDIRILLKTMVVIIRKDGSM